MKRVHLYPVFFLIFSISWIRGFSIDTSVNGTLLVDTAEVENVSDIQSDMFVRTYNDDGISRANYSNGSEKVRCISCDDSVAEFIVSSNNRHSPKEQPKQVSANFVEDSENATASAIQSMLTKQVAYGSSERRQNLSVEVIHESNTNLLEHSLSNLSANSSQKGEIIETDVELSDSYRAANNTEDTTEMTELSSQSKSIEKYSVTLTNGDEDHTVVYKIDDIAESTKNSVGLSSNDYPSGGGGVNLTGKVTLTAKNDNRSYLAPNSVVFNQQSANVSEDTETISDIEEINENTSSHTSDSSSENREFANRLFQNNVITTENGTTDVKNRKNLTAVSIVLQMNSTSHESKSDLAEVRMKLHSTRGNKSLTSNETNHDLILILNEPDMSEEIANVDFQAPSSNISTSNSRTGKLNKLKMNMDRYETTEASLLKEWLSDETVYKFVMIIDRNVTWNEFNLYLTLSAISKYFNDSDLSNVKVMSFESGDRSSLSWFNNSVGANDCKLAQSAAFDLKNMIGFDNGTVREAFNKNFVNFRVRNITLVLTVDCRRSNNSNESILLAVIIPVMFVLFLIIFLIQHTKGHKGSDFNMTSFMTRPTTPVILLDESERLKSVSSEDPKHPSILSSDYSFRNSIFDSDDKANS